MADKNLLNILRNTAVLLEIKGENPFKARAYSNAAMIIEEEALDIATLAKESKLENIPGFGEALVKKLTEYVETGKIGYYDKLIEEVPETLVAMTKIAGIGIRKVKQLYEQLGIKSISDLEQACRENKISGTKGFGAVTQDNILNSIEHIKASEGRYLQEDALGEAETILNVLKNLSSVSECSVTAENRRFAEVVDKFEYLVSANDIALAEQDISKQLNCRKQENSLVTLTSQGVPLVINVVREPDYIWQLHRSTGNHDYLRAFEEYANGAGFKYGENGLYRGNEVLNFKTEEEIYSILELQYIPPELRESGDAIKKAIAGEIPTLVEDKDLRGMIHLHTLWSDGKNTIRDMALKTKELGFTYIAICDHSRAAVYANGLSIERVKQQHEEIDKLNEEGLGIKILKGIESDILEDGSLDYPEDVLKSFDIVVASIHSGFKMAKDKINKRLVNALKNKYTTILGHPTGRLLLTRQGYQLDIKDVVDAASDYGKTIEINSNPSRLDLSWENVIYAREKGVKIAITPDSHRTETLKDVFMGVKVARKGWLSKADVINCLEYDDFFKKYVLKK